MERWEKMIRLKTINVDDGVLKLTVDGKSKRSYKHFTELIHGREILFWRGASNIKRMEERKSLCNDNTGRNPDSLEKISQTVTEYCSHCNNEITMEWDVSENGYEASCAMCGLKLMLCSECLYGEELCDWNEKKGFCYRQVEQLWKEFEQVAFAEDEEYRLVLDEEYEIALIIDFEDGRKPEKETLMRFPEGTDREEIWKWYDENHPKGVAYLLYGEDKKKVNFDGY